jgi:hypothetical protein
MHNSGTQINDHVSIQGMNIINPWSNMFNQNMQPLNSIPATRGTKITALQRTLGYQRTPYSEPTQVSKGLTTSNAGGSFILYDKTGGTEIFSYNPLTGVVTINGSLIAQSSNTGTYSNITLAGTNQINGTMLMGFFGTPQITGGTINNAVIGTSQAIGGTANFGVYQIGGTAGYSGTVAFVRSVSPGTVLGSLIFNNGLLIGTS